MKNYIESNNRLYSFINPLREIQPNAKFIHVVRDGREVVRSDMSRNFCTDMYKRYRIAASYFPNDPYYNSLDQMDRFEKICWW